MAAANDSLTVVVDDSETSRITYSAGNWQVSGSQGEFNETTHGAFAVGALATFAFNGTSVAVYGTVGPASSGIAVTTYGLDNDPILTYTAPNTPSTIQQVLFYQSPILTFATHTLVITSINASSYWLDYLTYTIPDPSTPLVSSTSSSITSSTITPQSSTSSAPIPTFTSKSKASVGAVVGGTLGGVAFSLVAAALLFLWFLRSRRYKYMITGENGEEYKQGMTDMEPQTGEVIPFPSQTPFIVGEYPSANQGNYPQPMFQPNPSNPLIPPSSTEPGSSTQARVVNPAPTKAGRHPPIPAITPEVQHHEDGGVRLAGGVPAPSPSVVGSSSDGLTNVPPAYQQF